MALVLLAAQLAVGGGVLALAWRLAGGPATSSRREASSDLIRGALLAGAAVAILELAAGATGTTSPVLSVLAAGRRTWRWLYLVGGLATAPGCWLAIAAGQAERRGDLERAWREVRLAGFVASCGALVQTVSSLASLIAAGFSPGSRWPNVASLVTTAAAGCAALLGGLSAKPRPAAYVAAVLVVVSALAWLTAR
jgi:hypothetical protein